MAYREKLVKVSSPFHWSKWLLLVCYRNTTLNSAYNQSKYGKVFIKLREKKNLFQTNQCMRELWLNILELNFHHTPSVHTWRLNSILYCTYIWTKKKGLNL